MGRCAGVWRCRSAVISGERGIPEAILGIEAHAPHLWETFQQARTHLVDEVLDRHAYKVMESSQEQIADLLCCDVGGKIILGDCRRSTICPGYVEVDKEGSVDTFGQGCIFITGETRERTSRYLHQLQPIDTCEVVQKANTCVAIAFHLHHAKRSAVGRLAEKYAARDEPASIARRNRHIIEGLFYSFNPEPFHLRVRSEEARP